jgi:hypothetical protein
MLEIKISITLAFYVMLDLDGIITSELASQ